MRIILASGSPRRKELLSKLNKKFEIIKVDADEIVNKKLSLKKQVLSIAKVKAMDAVSETSGSRIIIAADTMVCVEKQNLGKPEDKKQATNYLERLSGKWHKVITAMVVIKITNDGRPKIVNHIDVSKVKFKILTSEEIEWYIETGEPMDKAGAYAVQGLGGKFIEKIKGNKNAIIGLNIEKLEKVFNKLEIY